MDIDKLMEEAFNLRFRKLSDPDIAKVYSDVDCDRIIERCNNILCSIWCECKKNVFDNDVSQS